MNTYIVLLLLSITMISLPCALHADAPDSALGQSLIQPGEPFQPETMPTKPEPIVPDPVMPNPVMPPTIQAAESTEIQPSGPTNSSSMSVNSINPSTQSPIAITNLPILSSDYSNRVTQTSGTTSRLPATTNSQRTEGNWWKTLWR